MVMLKRERRRIKSASRCLSMMTILRAFAVVTPPPKNHYHLSSNYRREILQPINKGKNAIWLLMILLDQKPETAAFFLKKKKLFCSTKCCCPCVSLHSDLAFLSSLQAPTTKENSFRWMNVLCNLVSPRVRGFNCLSPLVILDRIHLLKCMMLARPLTDHWLDWTGLDWGGITLVSVTSLRINGHKDTYYMSYITTRDTIIDMSYQFVATDYRSFLTDTLDRVTGFLPSWPLPPRELVPQRKPMPK